MDSTATDALIDKIRKLAAKAAGTDSEAEAAAFSAKVQQLLAAHNLSEDVLSAESDDPAPIGEEIWEDYVDEKWRRSLTGEVARLYFCSTYSVDAWHRTADGHADSSRPSYLSIKFVGRAHNVAIARSMAEYLTKTTNRLARDYAPQNRPARSTFKKACGYRLAVRMQELRLAQQRDAPKTRDGNPHNLPALYASEQTLVQNFLKDKGLRSFGRAGTYANDEHAAAGRAAANSVSLSAQVGGPRTRLLS